MGSNPAAKEGSMARRALVIGSEVGGLAGCDSDVTILGDAFAAMGFSLRRLTGDSATRAGMIAAYQELIAEAGPGDAVVVTYSGHGGRQRNLDPGLGPAFWQYLVPTDIEKSNHGDFRGLLAEELRLLQLQLTLHTANVTTILDCCHSGRMSRRIGLVPRFWKGSWPVGAVAERWAAADAALRQAVRDADLGPEWLEDNPRAVRVVACRADESAFELAMESGGIHGALTVALVEIFSNLPTAATWDEVAPRLRRLVAECAPEQHPGVEGGLGHRVVFELHEGTSGVAYPVVVSAAGLELEGARFFGFEEGDSFLLRPSESGPDGAGLGARVTGDSGGRAVLQLDGDAGSGTMAQDMLAYPVRRRLGRRPVVVEPADHRLRRDVVAALTAEPHVRVVDDPTRCLAIIRLVGDDSEDSHDSDSGLLLLDGDRSPLWIRPRPVNAATLGQLNQALAILASAARLRELAPTDAERLPTPVSMQVHEPDGTMLEPGALVAGDCLKIAIRNDGPSSSTVYVNLFDIGLAGTIGPLSVAVDGVPVVGQETYRVGDGAGVSVHWPDPQHSPDPVPRDEPRPESYVAIVSDRPQDLRRLKTRGVLGDPPTSSLQRLFDTVRSGTRDSSPNPYVQPVRFSVLRFDFLLDPGFLIDDSDSPAGQALDDQAAAAAVPSPSHLGVVLDKLIVGSSGAIFGTDVRLDALFSTSGGVDQATPWQAWTGRFPRLADGDELALESPVLYDGPVWRFLDIALWMSRDDRDGPDLAELLGRALSTAPPGPPGPRRSLVHIASRLLRAEMPRSVGLFHTTLRPPEGFKPGRRPAAGVTSIRDFGFAYRVTV
jgi:hypothetical protein